MADSQWEGGKSSLLSSQMCSYESQGGSYFKNQPEVRENYIKQGIDQFFIQLSVYRLTAVHLCFSSIGSL